MARILIVGGGCRGRQLARELVDSGHAVRITTRSHANRAAIEQAGAECFIGTPDRLATLRGALDRVAVVCWLLAGAGGGEEVVAELHSARLRAFVHQIIDTTARGLVYERGATSAESFAALESGERIVRQLAEQNAIPLVVLGDDIGDRDAWLRGARGAVARLLGD
jgi:Trk K+ transport system NAD-binding subunit